MNINLPGKYAKFFVAALTVIGVILAQLLAHGVTQQWVVIAVGIVNALGVFLVPNVPPSTPVATPGTATVAPTPPTTPPAAQ